MSFKKEGFLSEETQKFRHRIIQSNIEIISLAYDSNIIANKMKSNFNISTFNTKHIVVGDLFVKILQSYNSSLILYERGLESDAKTISRRLTENAMKLCAICNNEEFFNNYLLEKEYERFNQIEGVQANPSHFGEDLFENFSSIDIKEVKKNIKKPKYYKTSDFAALANMEDVYFNVYKNLCSNIHSDIKNVSQSLIIDNNKEQFEYDISPRSDDIKLVLATNINILIRVLLKLNDLFKLAYNDELEEVNKILSSMFNQSYIA